MVRGLLHFVLHVISFIPEVYCWHIQNYCRPKGPLVCPFQCFPTFHHFLKCFFVCYRTENGDYSESAELRQSLEQIWQRRKAGEPLPKLFHADWGTRWFRSSTKTNAECIEYYHVRHSRYGSTNRQGLGGSGQDDWRRKIRNRTGKVSVMS